MHRKCIVPSLAEAFKLTIPNTSISIYSSLLYTYHVHMFVMIESRRISERSQCLLYSRPGCRILREKIDVITNSAKLMYNIGSN